jgi:hypothetical protein
MTNERAENRPVLASSLGGVQTILLTESGKALDARSYEPVFYSADDQISFVAFAQAVGFALVPIWRM